MTSTLLRRPGRALSRRTAGRETGFVLVSGRAAVRAGDSEYGVIGERRSPFEGSPWSVYVPAGAAWRVNAPDGCELAVCTAPAEGKLPPRLIRPDDVGQEMRGQGTTVRNILPDTAEAESLLVVEVVTPGRALVERSAAQARHGRPSARDLLPPARTRIRVRAAARLYR